MEEITLAESTRLIELERQIKGGLDTFVQVGEALLEIRDSRLYRIEHSTFEDYCREKWKFTHDFARKLIRGSEVVQNIKSNTTVSLPQSERQARPLTKLPPEKQSEAWQKAIESAGGKQPTAKQVEAAVLEVLPPEQISPEEPATSEEPKKLPQLPKYTGDYGLQIADNAIRILSTILTTDPQRNQAFQKVINYCTEQLS